MPNFSKEPYAITGGGGGGMRFLSGEGEPTADTGQPGDVYLDTTNGDLYENVNGTWTKVMNLRGPKGEKGDRGDTGAKGADGFPTQAQWDALVARVEALEGAES